MNSQLKSGRLQLIPFDLTDSDEVFQCITPAIARFMPWEMPQSLSEYKARREIKLRTEAQFNFSFVIRRCDTMECLGMAALEGVDSPSPELGIWLKEAAHGHGYGGEAIKVMAEWASKNLGKESFIYPVAVQNVASRRIAEALKGTIVEHRTNPKYDSVVYKIPALGIADMSTSPTPDFPL